MKSWHETWRGSLAGMAVVLVMQLGGDPALAQESEPVADDAFGAAEEPARESDFEPARESEGAEPAADDAFAAEEPARASDSQAEPAARDFGREPAQAGGEGDDSTVTFDHFQTNRHRLRAAQRQVEATSAAYHAGTVSIDLALDAIRRLVDSEIAVIDSATEITGVDSDSELKAFQADAMRDAYLSGQHKSLDVWKIANAKSDSEADQAQEQVALFSGLLKKMELESHPEVAPARREALRGAIGVLLGRDIEPINYVSAESAVDDAFAAAEEPARASDAEPAREPEAAEPAAEDAFGPAEESPRASDFGPSRFPDRTFEAQYAGAPDEAAASDFDITTSTESDSSVEASATTQSDLERQIRQLNAVLAKRDVELAKRDVTIREQNQELQMLRVHVQAVLDKRGGESGELGSMSAEQQKWHDALLEESTDLAQEAIEAQHKTMAAAMQLRRHVATGLSEELSSEALEMVKEVMKQEIEFERGVAIGRQALRKLPTDHRDVIEVMLGRVEQAVGMLRQFREELMGVEARYSTSATQVPKRPALPAASRPVPAFQPTAPPRPAAPVQQSTPAAAPKSPPTIAQLPLVTKPSRGGHPELEQAVEKLQSEFDELREEIRQLQQLVRSAVAKPTKDAEKGKSSYRPVPDLGNEPF